MNSECCHGSVCGAVIRLLSVFRPDSDGGFAVAPFSGKTFGSTSRPKVSGHLQMSGRVMTGLQQDRQQDRQDTLAELVFFRHACDENQPNKKLHLLVLLRVHVLQSPRTILTSNRCARIWFGPSTTDRQTHATHQQRLLMRLTVTSALYYRNAAHDENKYI